MENNNKEITIKKSDSYAYISGCFNNSTKTYGYGGLIIHNEETHKIQGKGNEKNLIQLGSVGSQIAASKETIKKAIELGVKNIDIFYDYDGIEKWATREWKAKNEETKNYYNFILNIKPEITINFRKNNKEYNSQKKEAYNLAREEAFSFNNDKKEVNKSYNNIYETSKNSIKMKHIKKRIIRKKHFSKFEFKKLPDFIKNIFKDF